MIVEQIQQLTTKLAARRPPDDPSPFVILTEHVLRLRQLGEGLGAAGFGLRAATRGIPSGRSKTISGHLGLTVAGADDLRWTPSGKNAPVLDIGPHLADVLMGVKTLPLTLDGQRVDEFNASYRGPTMHDFDEGHVHGPGPARDPFDALLRTIRETLAATHRRTLPEEWRGFKEDTRIATYDYPGGYWMVMLFKGGRPQCAV